MNYIELLKKIEKGKIENLYLFYGKEKYLIDETLNIIIDKFIGTDKASFNLETAYGDEISVSNLLNMVQTIPLIGKKKIIIIKNSHELKNLNNKDLLFYIKSPSPNTCLILISYSPEKIKAKKIFYEALTKYGVQIEFKPLYDNQIIGWINKKLEKNNIIINNDALKFLISSVGSNLQSIHNELEKVITFIGKEKKITRKDIESIICHIDLKSKTIFNLTDSIVEKNISGSISFFNSLILQGIPIQMILTMITRQFRLILHSKILYKKKYTDNQVQKKMKIKPFILKKLKKQAMNFTIEEVENCFSKILSTDLLLKTSTVDPKLAMQNLFFNLTLPIGL